MTQNSEIIREKMDKFYYIERSLGVIITALSKQNQTARKTWAKENEDTAKIFAAHSQNIS